MVTNVLSAVRIRVLRKPIFSTVPLILLAVKVSPAVKGLSKKMMNEAIKFSKLSLQQVQQQHHKAKAGK